MKKLNEYLEAALKQSSRNFKTEYQYKRYAVLDWILNLTPDDERRLGILLEETIGQEGIKKLYAKIDEGSGFDED